MFFAITTFFFALGTLSLANPTGAMLLVDAHFLHPAWGIDSFNLRPKGQRWETIVEPAETLRCEQAVSSIPGAASWGAKAISAVLVHALEGAL